MEQDKRKYFASFGLFAAFAIAPIMEGNWLEALPWLAWLLWFLYLIPPKKGPTN